MAVVFLLNVSFPSFADQDLAEATRLVSVAELRLRGERVETLQPFVRVVANRQLKQRFIEFSVHPCGVGHGGPGELPFPITDVTADDLRRLGDQLYDLLRQFDGFLAGYVGWDSEWLVDLGELEAEWLEDGSIYDLKGLVLAEHLVAKWSLDERFEPFKEAYRWVPYAGTPIWWWHGR